MEAGAGVRALHAAVAGQEGAAPAQREAVGGVVAQEQVLGHLGQGQGGQAGPGGRSAGQGGIVGQGGEGQGGGGGVGGQPLQLAAAHQRVAAHQEAGARTWTRVSFLKFFLSAQLGQTTKPNFKQRRFAAK